MKEQFRKNLEIYSKLAKEKLFGADENNDLDTVIRWHINDASKSRASNPMTQSEILELQKRKQEIIYDLKSKIRDLDKSEKVAKKVLGQIDVSFKDGHLCSTDAALGQTNISLGEILTDIEWGISYYLDPVSVPKNIRKRYLIEKAKHTLSQLLNVQIAKDEISNRDTDAKKKAAYSTIVDRIERGSEQGGIIAEIIVKNFIKKLVINNSLDIEVIETDAKQDVENKIDFIIRRKRHIRGVNVEASQTENIGVQFTTNYSSLKLKEDQISRVKKSRELAEEHIKDLVLVSLPASVVLESFNNWNASGKKPGGPDKLLSSQNKKTIFFGLLKDILPQDEINREWELISKQF